MANNLPPRYILYVAHGTGPASDPIRIATGNTVEELIPQAPAADFDRDGRYTGWNSYCWIEENGVYLFDELAIRWDRDFPV